MGLSSLSGLSGLSGMAGGGSAGASILTSSLIAEYRLNEGTGRNFQNSLASSNPANLFLLPEGNFGYSSVWVGAGGTPTITEGQSDPLGGSRATRIQTVGNMGVRQNVSTASGQYTIRIWIKSNTGSSQSFRFYFNGAFTSDQTATTSWQEFIISNTPGVSTAAQIAPLYAGSANANLDVLVYGAQLFQGTSTAAYVPVQGNLIAAKTPTFEAAGINTDLGAGVESPMAAVIDPGTTFAQVSMYFVGKFPKASSGTSGYAFGVGVSPSTGALELWPQHNGGGARVLATFRSTNASSDTLANAHDGLWHCYAMTYDGTALKCYMDGIEVASTTAALSSVTGKFIGVGAGPVNALGFHWPGSIAYSSVYNTGHSAAQVKANMAAIAAYLAPRSITPETTRYAVADGDSIIAGFLLTTGTDYFRATLAADSSTVQGANIAVGGSTMADLTTRAARVDAVLLTGRKCALVIADAFNDLKVSSAATVFAAIKTYVTARRAAGWGGVNNPILYVNALASTDAVAGPRIDAFNALVNAEPLGTASWADAVCRFDNLGSSGATGAQINPSDTAVLSDGVHPTQTFCNTVLAPRFASTWATFRSTFSF